MGEGYTRMRTRGGVRVVLELEELDGGRNGGRERAISHAGFMGYCWRKGWRKLACWLGWRWGMC
jgi:hypothetical protein